MMGDHPFKPDVRQVKTIVLVATVPFVSLLLRGRALLVLGLGGMTLVNVAFASAP